MTRDYNVRSADKQIHEQNSADPNNISFKPETLDPTKTPTLTLSPSLATTVPYALQADRCNC